MKLRLLSEEPISVHDLPPPNIRVWGIHAKAKVVTALNKGLMTLEDAVLYYGLEQEVIIAWCDLYESEGLGGLRVTRVQTYWKKKLERNPELREKNFIPASKRSALWSRGHVVTIGPLTLVYKRYGRRNEILYHGEELPIRPGATEILALLMKHKGRVVPKLEILQHLYGNDFATRNYKIIDVSLNHVRSEFMRFDRSLRLDSIIVTLPGRGHAISPQLLKRDEKSRT